MAAVEVLGAGGGAFRIGGPDQPQPTGPQMIVADRFLFLQAAAHPLHAVDSTRMIHLNFFFLEIKIDIKIKMQIQIQIQIMQPA